MYLHAIILLASPLLASAAAVPADVPPAITVRDTSVAPIPSDPAWYNSLLAYANPLRLQHHAVPFVWSNAQASFALAQSNKCALKHSGGPYGENIYWTSASALNFTQATFDAIDAWMSEQPAYHASDPMSAGHYTAMVWQASKRIGCAWTGQTCNGGNGGFYFFCEFDPVGNVIGQFAQNVYPIVV